MVEKETEFSKELKQILQKDHTLAHLLTTKKHVRERENIPSHAHIVSKSLWKRR